jgi:hypothetical protein
MQVHEPSWFWQKCLAKSSMAGIAQQAKFPAYVVNR